MKILGISGFYHDSAAAIICDGEIIAAAQEERFSRIKNDPAFPSSAIRFCLEYAECGLDEVDAIVFYDKPFLKFERLLETYYAYAPSGWLSFLRSMPVWIKEKLFLKKIIYGELKAIGAAGKGGGDFGKRGGSAGKVGGSAGKRAGAFDKKKTPLLFPEHHLSHAASAYYPSPFEEAAILTLDGVGEWATVSISRGRGRDIEVLRELDFPHSLGLLYSAFTYYCGFAVNSGEYKLMGLAPYGDKDSAECRRMVEIIRTVLTDIREDGSIFLKQEYFQYATGSRMVKDRRWEMLFGFPRRQEEGPLGSCYCNMALAIQQVTEEVVIRLAKEARRLTGSENLCLAGGVALNCVANGKLQEAGIFSGLFIQPAAGDAGGALGAALAAYHIYYGGERKKDRMGDGSVNAGETGAMDAGAMDAMKGAYLGPEFSDIEVEAMARRQGAAYRKMESPEALVEATARMISEGRVVGWFQGRMEFGPRALGARSILADARNPGMQKKLNLSIKNREGFRPFAPAVLAEDVQDYFEVGGGKRQAPMEKNEGGGGAWGGPGEAGRSGRESIGAGEKPGSHFISPYMLLVKGVRRSRRHPLPEGYAAWGMADKLNFVRSDLPATTHIDHSARVQTVHRETNPLFWLLLRSFKELTGCAVLINTSFNVRDEPIVNTPEEAYRCLMRTEMDCLVMGNLVFDKREQGR